MTTDTAVAAGDRLRRRGLLLAALTITWNTIEAIVAVSAGVAAGSIALVGFGFDSMIEVLSAWVVVWQFRGELRGGYDEDRERQALRIIGITFFVLAAYVAVEAIRDLFFVFFVDAEPEESAVGIVLAAVSLAVMPALAWAKRRTAAQLGSPTLRADATETLLCSWLSAALLAGLVLNAAVGWWWADPIAALAIAALATHEGLEAIRGDHDYDDHHHDNPERLHNERTFAHLCGVAPVDASSGKHERHRLNRGGNRQANAALWRIVVTRMVYDPRTRAYIDRRTKDGLTKKEAFRCLKRYIAREVYNHLPHQRLALDSP